MPIVQSCRWRPSDAAGIVARFGLEPQQPALEAEGSALVTSRVGPGGATAQTAHAINEKAGGCIFVSHNLERVTALYAIIPVTSQGLAALAWDSFSGVEPPLRYVAAPGDKLAAVYGWVFVGSTVRSMASVVGAAKALRDDYAQVPFYARAATEAGHRVLTQRLGYLPATASRTGLLCSPPLDIQLHVAA
jgi:hypothetical protein